MNKQRRKEAICVVSQSGKANETDTVDRFTCLPHDIIKKVLACLSMRSACRTCFSSKKLMHLLNSIPHLRFGHKEHEFRFEDYGRAPMEIAERFLKKRDDLIKSFWLQLDLQKDTFNFAQWVTLLVQKGIEELGLDILNGKYELPSHLFNSETIRVLTLWRCSFKLPPNFTGFGLVETMFLGEISLTNHIISCLLSKCVVLRTLTFHKCNGFKKIEMLEPNSRLECLKLKYCPTAITLTAPKLHTLYYYCDTVNLHLKGALHPMNVIYFRRELEDHPLCNYPGEGKKLKKNVLNYLAHVQSLSLTGWAFKSLATGQVPKTMGLTYCSLGKLTLQIDLNHHRELKALTCWLRSCPNLKKLFIQLSNHVTDDDLYEYPLRFGAVMAYLRLIQRDPEEYDSIEFIDISGFNVDDTEQQTEFIKFILAKTKKLKELILHKTKMQPHREEVMKMPRASRDVKIKVTFFIHQILMIFGENNNLLASFLLLRQLNLRFCFS